MIFPICITKYLYSIFSLPCLLHALPLSDFMIYWPYNFTQRVHIKISLFI